MRQLTSWWAASSRAPQREVPSGPSVKLTMKFTDLTVTLRWVPLPEVHGVILRAREG
jgi:hypothetical protein